MSKHPCGVCEIGCRYSSVKCMGICTKWFHSRCVNITDSDYKAMSKKKDSRWTCSECSLSHKISLSKKDSTSTSSRNMMDIKDKIKLFETSLENDLETSLSLAAEVGKALLLENEQLKQELYAVKQKIPELQLQLEDNLKDAKDEIKKLTIVNMERENEYIAKLAAMTKKADLGLTVNEELLLLNENDRIKSSMQIKEMDMQIKAYRNKIQKLEFELSKNAIDMDKESVQVLQTELETKREIIKVLKNDLDHVTLELGIIKKKYEDLTMKLEISINSESNMFTNRPTKKTCNQPKYTELAPIEVNNRFSLLDSDFPEINTERRNSMSKTTKNRTPATKINQTSYEGTKSGRSREDRTTTTSISHHNKVGNNPVSYTRSRRKIQPVAAKMNKTSCNKVLILADSHGRNMSGMLENELQESYNVSSVIYPNACLNQVVNDINNLTRTFTKKDFVIVIGGTNDLERNVSSSFDKCLKYVISCTSNTNLILTTIPPRYDKYIQENLRTKLNNIFTTCTQHIEHAQVIDFQEFDRNDFTNHGLHLNYRGKLKLTKNLCGIICNDTPFKSIPVRVSHRDYLVDCMNIPKNHSPASREIAIITINDHNPLQVDSDFL